MFGRYRLEELIGRGGMGEVWRAVDTGQHNRPVAVKRLTADRASDHDFRARFEREAEIASHLNDPHIIPIHNCGEINGRPFLDMRLVPGKDLRTVLQQVHELDLLTAVDVLEQVAGALDAAHDVGLIHRDVKPANILFNAPSDGGVPAQTFVYLIDFGIAAAADGPRLTLTGHMAGTPDYMAPERFSGYGDHRVDVYALGCLLHEMLTGNAPFSGDGPQLMRAHREDPPPRPSELRSDVPVAFDLIVASAMAKDPDDRPDRASEVAAVARRALHAVNRDQVSRTAATDPVATVPAEAGVDSTSGHDGTASPGAGVPRASPESRPQGPRPAPATSSGRRDGEPPPTLLDGSPPPAARRGRSRRTMVYIAVLVTVLAITGALLLAVGSPGSVVDAPVPVPPSTRTGPPAVRSEVLVGRDSIGVDVAGTGAVAATSLGDAAVRVLSDGREPEVLTLPDRDFEIEAAATAPVGGAPVLVPVSRPDGADPSVNPYESSTVALPSRRAWDLSDAGVPRDLVVLDDRHAWVATNGRVADPDPAMERTPEADRQAVNLVGIDPSGERLRTPIPIRHDVGRPSGVGVFRGAAPSIVHVIVVGPADPNKKTDEAVRTDIVTVDVASGRTLASRSVEGAFRDGVADPDGTRVYLARTGGAGYVIVDLRSGAVVGRTGGQVPTGVAVSADGRTLLVVHRTSATDDQGTLAAIDTRDQRVLATILVGRAPNAVALAPDDGVAYVSAKDPASGSGVVFVVDVSEVTKR